MKRKGSRRTRRWGDGREENQEGGVFYQFIAVCQGSRQNGGAVLMGSSHKLRSWRQSCSRDRVVRYRVVRDMGGERAVRDRVVRDRGGER